MGDIENELSSDTSGHNMMFANLTTWGDHLYANPRQALESSFSMSPIMSGDSNDRRNWYKLLNIN
jgi:hypothetical protein